MPDLTLEEKVAKLEKEMQEAVPSPTGTPLIPPTAFKWVALVVGVALSALVSLIAIYPDAKGLQVALAIVSAIAAVLGIASPGIRKAVVVLLVVGSMVGLSGCVTIKRIGTTAELAAPALLDCGFTACKDALPGLISIAAAELGKVIAGGKFDVEPVIDRLLAEKGPFMACAVAELLKAWEQAGDGAGLPAPADLRERRLMFLAAHVGQTHLLVNGYVLR